MNRHEPTEVGVGIGVVGVAFVALTTALLVLVPGELLAPAARSAYVETWSRPVMTVGRAVTAYGIPIVGAVAAYHLTTKDHDPRGVVAGFVVGALVLVVGSALYGTTVTNFFAYGTGIERSFPGHVENSVPLGVRLFGGALAGTVCAVLVEGRR